MISKLWLGLAVAAIIIGAFLWLRSGCGKPNVADATQIAMTALKSGYDSAKREDQGNVNRLKDTVKVLTTLLAEEKKRKAPAAAALQTRKGNAERTISRLDSARIAKDTAGQLRQGDSLEAQVKSGIPAIEAFTHLQDSLINTEEQIVAAKDSVIFFQDKLIKKADTTITAQQLQYAIIHKDDARKTAALKFYRPVAIGGIAAVALIVVISLLHH